MNSHARRCTLKLKRRNCFLIYIYYNLSLKTYIITFSFFFSFFLYRHFFLSFYCYFYLSDTGVDIDCVICVRVIHVTRFTRNLVISYLRLYFVTDYI